MADERSELFARALDGEVDELDAELRRELAMVSLLVSAGSRMGPDDAARHRMRERIVAGLAQPGPAHSGPAQPGRLVQLTPMPRRRSAAAGVQGRLLVAAAASLCLLVALSAMSLVLARDALPGDVLYGFKRSAESAELGLTFGDEPRGFKHLQFATARVDELEALAARADGLGNNRDTARYLTALQAFDADTAAGSRLLIETATSGDGDELAALRGWAEQQRLRLDGAGTAMPARADARMVSSLVLLDRVTERAIDLQLRWACVAVTSGVRDDLGLLPAEGECVPAVGRSLRVPSTSLPDLTQPRRTVVAPQPTLMPAQPAGAEPQQPTEPIGPLDPGVPDPTETPSPGGGPVTEGPTSPGVPPVSTASAIVVPLPLPLGEITVPSLLPGVPGLRVG